jgi:ribosome maturation protein SDO1
MANVEARIRAKGKHFEISVDFEEALKVKKGGGNITSALNSTGIYYDIKKGTIASQKDLQECFNTTNIYEISEKIIKNGELMEPKEHRDAEKEEKIKRIINLIVRNASDQYGKSFTEERIRKAIDEVHYNFDSRADDIQMINLVEKIKRIIPIKIETKKIKLTIPAQFSGQVYGLLKSYLVSEEWLSNGSLSAIINIPAGMQIDFYEKLNSITHGAVVSEEVGE